MADEIKNDEIDNAPKVTKLEIDGDEIKILKADEDPLIKEIEPTVIEAINMFRPQLQADGGDIEYVGIDEQKRVHLNMTGACGGCPMAVMDLKMGLEVYIKDACPEITEVVQDNAMNLSEGDWWL